MKQEIVIKVPCPIILLVFVIKGFLFLIMKHKLQKNVYCNIL